MAEDQLLLHVRVLAEGQQDLVKIQTQMGQLFQRTTVAQEKQAATAQHHGEILGSLASRVNLLTGNIQSLQLRLYEMGGAFAVVGLGAAATAYTFGQLKDIMEAGAKEEKWQASFEVIMGGAAGARRQLEYLTQFAKTSPFELPDVVEASRQLEVLDLDTRKYIGTLGDMSAVMNIPLKEGVDAIAQVARGRFEEIRRFVPDIEGLMAKAGIDELSGTKKTQAQLHKLIDEIMTDLNERYGGGMAKLSQTTDTKLKSIGETWFEFKANIAKSGVGEEVNKLLDDVLDRLKKLEADGTLARWEKEISGSMVAVLDNAEKLEKTLEDLKGPVIFLAGTAGIILLARTVSALAIALGGAAVKSIGYIESAIAAAAADRAAAAAAALRAAGYEALAVEMEATAAAGAASATATTVAAAGLGGLGKGLLALVGGPVGAAVIGVLGLTYVLDKLAAGAKPAAERERDLRVEFDTGKISADQYREALEKLHAEEAKKVQKEKTDREAPISSPLPQMAAQNQSLAEQMIENAGKPQGEGRKKGTTPPAPDPEAIKAHQEAIRQIVQEWAAGVKERIGLSEFEAKTQVELLERVRDTEVSTVKDAYQKKLEMRDIDKMIDEAKHRAAIEAAKKEADAQVDEMRKVAALRGEDTAEYLQDLQRRLAATDKFSLDYLAIKNEVKATEKKLADERIADLRFESELQGQTTDQYIFLLRAKLSVLSSTSEEAKAIIAEINKASEDAVLEEQRRTKTLGDLFRQRAEDRRNAQIEIEADLLAAGQSQDRATQGSKAAAEMQAFDNDQLAATNAYLQSAQGMWFEFYANLLGVHEATWSQMSDSERQKLELARILSAGTWGAAAGFVKGFTTTATKELTKFFETGKTSTGVLKEVVLESFKEMAAGGVQAIADQAKADAAYNAAKALEALASGLMGHPGAFAAAAQYGLAAAKFSALAVVAGGAAAAITAGESGGAADTGSQAGSGNTISGAQPNPQSNRLQLSQASQPITQYFYLNLSWEGGANFFGRDAADAIVQQIIPSLQEAFDSKQLRVPA